jgi:hypothetical protein
LGSFTKTVWATFRAIFSQTNQVTLQSEQVIFCHRLSRLRRFHLIEYALMMAVMMIASRVARWHILNQKSPFG